MRRSPRRGGLSLATRSAVRSLSCDALRQAHNQESRSPRGGAVARRNSRPQRDPARPPVARTTRATRGQHDSGAPKARCTPRPPAGRDRGAPRTDSQGHRRCPAAALGRHRPRARGRVQRGRGTQGRVRLHRAPAARHRGGQQRSGRPRAARGGRRARDRAQGACQRARRRARHRSGSRVQVPGAREVRARPHRRRARGQDGSGGGTRRGDPPPRDSPSASWRATCPRA